MRAAINSDVPLIMKRLLELQGYSTAPHVQFADAMAAELHLRDVIHENGHSTEVTDNCRAVIVDGFFIMFQVAPMWCTTVNFLMEEMVIRLDGNESASRVPYVLKQLQERFNCVAFFGGDSQGDYMGKHYRAAGCVHSGTLYIGGHNGNGPQVDGAEGRN
jgi:hypothetical protein